MYYCTSCSSFISIHENVESQTKQLRGANSFVKQICVCFGCCVLTYSQCPSHENEYEESLSVHNVVSECKCISGLCKVGKAVWSITTVHTEFKLSSNRMVKCDNELCQ